MARLKERKSNRPPSESLVDLIRQRLSKVNTANGFVGICDIVESDSVEGLRPRSIAIASDESGITLRIKASGKTLKALQQAVREMLSEEFQVEELDQTSKLIRRQ